jgi:hypothetical protein
VPPTLLLDELARTRMLNVKVGGMTSG